MLRLRCYDTLGIRRDSTAAEVRTAYRRCALSRHPDKGGSSEAFRKLVRVFETLVDPHSRQHYDSLLHAEGSDDGTLRTLDSKVDCSARSCSTGLVSGVQRRQKAQCAQQAPGPRLASTNQGKAQVVRGNQQTGSSEFVEQPAPQPENGEMSDQSRKDCSGARSARKVNSSTDSFRTEFRSDVKNERKAQSCQQPTAGRSSKRPRGGNVDGASQAEKPEPRVVIEPPDPLSEKEKGRRSSQQPNREVCCITLTCNPMSFDAGSVIENLLEKDASVLLDELKSFSEVHLRVLLEHLLKVWADKHARCANGKAGKSIVASAQASDSEAISSSCSTGTSSEPECEQASVAQGTLSIVSISDRVSCSSNDEEAQPMMLCDRMDEASEDEDDALSDRLSEPEGPQDHKESDRKRPRGILSKGPSFVAVVGISHLMFVSQTVRMLDDAISFHIIFLEIKACVDRDLRCIPPVPFDEAVQSAIREKADAAREVGLQMSLYLQVGCSGGPHVKYVKVNPTWLNHDLNAAMEYLLQARSHLLLARELGLDAFATRAVELREAARMQKMQFQQQRLETKAKAKIEKKENLQAMRQVARAAKVQERQAARATAKAQRREELESVRATKASLRAEQMVHRRKVSTLLQSLRKALATCIVARQRQEKAAQKAEEKRKKAEQKAEQQRIQQEEAAHQHRKAKLLKQILRKQGRDQLPQSIHCDLEQGKFFAVLVMPSGMHRPAPLRQQIAEAEHDLARLHAAMTNGEDAFSDLLANLEIEAFSSLYGVPWGS